MGTVRRIQPIVVKQIYPEWATELGRIMYRRLVLDKPAMSTERC